MNTYHVIVKKSDGTIIRSDKEIESSAIKSAKMYVNIRKEPAAVVILEKKVIFAIPEEIKTDRKFLAAALKKAYDQKEPVEPVAKTPRPAKTTNAPPSSLTPLAKAYDRAMKERKIVLPVTVQKTRSCDIEILESACLVYSLSRCIPMDRAQETCEKNKDQIEALASKMTQGALTKEEALQQMIAYMQGNCPMTTTNPSETKPTGPGIDISRVTRGRKDLVLPKTRFRHDVGGDDEEDPNDLKYRSLPDGIVIYTTKETDDPVHAAIAGAMGYAPSGLINPHSPANLTGYDYRRALPLMRPSVKVPRWSAFGGRIGNPSLLIQRIKQEFPDETKVKIEIAQGIELA